MCLFSTPEMPETPPPPMKADTNTDPTLAAWEEKRKQRMAQGYSSTLLTSGKGLANRAATQKKSLLGQ